MKMIFHINMIPFIFLSAFFYMSLADSSEPPSRSVNVALETSFLFEPKDLNHNIAFINNIKVFLDKLYHILAPQAQNIQQLRTHEAKPTIFDFLKEVGQKVMNITNDKVGKAVKIFKEEIKNAGGTAKDTFKYVIEKDKELQKFVKETIQGIVHPKEIKDNVRRLMSRKNPLLYTFARRLNDYYHPDEIKKLNKIVRKITRYLDKNKDVSKLVREALHIGVLNKINNLNETTRITLLHDIQLLSEFVKQQNEERRKEEIKNANRRALDFSGEGNSNLEEYANDSVREDDNYGENRIDKTNDDNLKQTDNKDFEEKHTNEIIVDNVELFLKSPI